MPVHFLKKNHVDQNVWDLALERTRLIFDLADHVAVSFSGGKDSTATLHVALAVAEERGRLPLHVIHFDEEAIPYETEHYVRRVAQDPRIKLDWYCLPVEQRNACSRKSPWWWCWAPEDEDKWVRPMPPEGITAEQVPGFPLYPPSARPSIPDLAGLLFPPSMGNVYMLLGIRADESITRFRAVARRRHDNYITPWGKNNNGPWDHPHLYKAYPIYDWTTNDVWTAPNLFGWDYNRAYDALEMAGVSIDQQRCSPAYGEEPLQKLWTYAHCFPDIWDAMTARVPGAATAGRYAITELYAFGQHPKPPDGVPWQDFIIEQVLKHNPNEQAHIVDVGIRKWIRLHHNHTADPILPTAPHPLTGVSWQRILMIAIRGDFKSRKQFQPGDDPAKRAGLQKRYDAERAELGL